MTPSDLRYQASRKWMEAEILAGRPVQHRRHVLSVDLDLLDEELAARVNAVLDGVVVEPESGRAVVLDSGIDPEKEYGPSENEFVSMDEPVVRVVGQLPELPEPTTELEFVLEAWEGWISRYCKEALGEISRLNQDRPTGKNASGKPIRWRGTRIAFGPDSEAVVRPEDGPQANQKARAAWLWNWATEKRFDKKSVEAAREATTPPAAESNSWIGDLVPEDLAERFLVQVKRMHAAAKAHEAARRVEAPGFDEEMERWTSEHGSDRLQLGIADGYRMNALYLAERLATEAPGFFAMPTDSAKENWARRAGSPSERALRLRRKVQAAMDQSAPENTDGKPAVEILTVTEPPPQIFLAQEEGDFANSRETEFPSKEGWPWYYDEDGNPWGSGAHPIEAVVVKNWLGRFHLIGAVADEQGLRPPGVWAVPDIDHFHDDGTVDPQDPESPAPRAARRKPPNPREDDIPF